MNNKKTIAEKLLQINAIKLSTDKPFTWASGWKSPIYCDNRRSLSFPLVRDIIKAEMCAAISASFPKANLLAGVATAGIAWGAMAADQLKLPYIYVRPKPKEHGLGNHIEGYYEKEMKVVVIEDLISTGKSSLEVVKVLKNSGLEVAGLVSIFNYGFYEAVEAFKKADVSYSSLTDYITLIALAIETGIVSEDEEKTLMEWRENPAKWRNT
jgi:orotate phosphoribosyltransferase